MEHVSLPAKFYFVKPSYGAPLLLRKTDWSCWSKKDNVISKLDRLHLWSCIFIRLSQIDCRPLFSWLENNGTIVVMFSFAWWKQWPAAVCSPHFVLTDPTIILVLIMMMMMMAMMMMMTMMTRACKILEFQFVLCASYFHILIAWGHFLLVSVNDFVRGWLILRPLPFGQVSFKSYLPSKKIYSSQTSGWDFFLTLWWLWWW